MIGLSLIETTRETDLRRDKQRPTMNTIHDIADKYDESPTNDAAVLTEAIQQDTKALEIALQEYNGMFRYNIGRNDNTGATTVGITFGEERRRGTVRDICSIIEDNDGYHINDIKFDVTIIETHHMYNSDVNKHKYDS